MEDIYVFVILYCISLYLLVDRYTSEKRFGVFPGKGSDINLGGGLTFYTFGGYSGKWTKWSILKRHKKRFAIYFIMHFSFFIILSIFRWKLL